MERIYQCDVAVVGGGIAGSSAAVAAAQAGAKTLLIERSPYLGGEATHSGVGAFCGLYSAGKEPVKVVAGVADQLLAEMAKLGDTFDYIISATGNKNVNFRQEYLKCALDKLLQSAGVECILHSRVVAAPAQNSSVTALTCADDEGLFTVVAKAFVDASGDANLVHLAGGKTTWGDENGEVQVATLPFRLSGVDTTSDLTPNAVHKAILAAKEAGIPNLTREKGFILKKAHSNTVTVLLPSVILKDMTGKTLTDIEQETRRQVLSYTEALRRFLPGCENCELVMIGPSIGFRESRKIHGRETLCETDILQQRKRENSVARGGWKPEIHKSLNSAATYIDLPDGSYFDIPLGALQSAELENVFGAGRIVSSDEVAYAAVRVMGTCFATGQAAGVAAACKAAKGVAEISAVRAELVRQGALL